MKKFLFLSVAILAFVLGSCSKEAKLNRKLDGKWELSTVDGVAPAADEKLTIEFTKDKKGKGTAVLTAVGMGLSIPGTYELVEDSQINLTLTFFGETDITQFKVKEYSRTSLVLTDIDGTDVSEFKKL